MTTPRQDKQKDQMDPTARLCRFLADRRPPFIVGLLVLLVSVAQIMTLVAQHRSAVIKADSYSYLVFAKELADGHLRMTGVLADAVEAFANNEKTISGPIWNTNVSPDGRIVFTIALGYPLVLSVAWILGGAWLATHLNLLLLTLVLLVLAACLWDRLGRDLFSLSVGSCSALLLVYSSPETFLQFSAPWREPLFYLCVIGATWAVAAYAEYGRLRAVAMAGLLLGYACAVKEASVVYAFALGICLLFFRRPFRVSSIVKMVSVFGISGVCGILPLFVQNISTSGNPFRSLQVERATREFTPTEPGFGFSGGNIPNTVERYVGKYVGEFGATLLVVIIVLVCIGFLCRRRAPIVQAMSSLFLVHVMVYICWGNAEFRHSYFAHIPICLCFALGLVQLFEWVLRFVPGIELYRHWVPLVPLILLAAKAPPLEPPEGPGFRVRDAIALTAEIERAAGARAVLLSNRDLRNLLDVYGKLPAIRLHDLAGFHPNRDVKEVIRWLMDRGQRVVFLDNLDQDPVNVGLVNWARKDQKWLLQDFDLTPAFTIPADQHGLKSFLGKEELTAHRVAAWTNTVVRRSLEAPEDGASFLFVDPRSAGQALQITLGETAFTGSPENNFYEPVRVAPGEGVGFEASAGGAPIPSLADTRLIGWHEEIGAWLGTDALHSDAAFFPDGVDDRIDAGSRTVTNSSVRMLVPVRQGPDLFTTIGLKVQMAPEDATTRIDLPNGEQFIVDSGSAVTYFPIHLPPVDKLFSGHAGFRIHSDEPTSMKLMRVESYVGYTRAAAMPPADALAMGLTGRLTPTVAGPGPHAWSARSDGKEIRRAKCLADPRRTWNGLAITVDCAGRTTPLEIEFEGAGLIDAQWVSVGEQMELNPDSGLDAFLEDFNNKETKFWWSKDESLVKVPVRSDRATYRVVLDFAGGRPGHKRPLTLRFAGAEQIVDPPDERAKQEITIEAANELTDGLEVLKFSIDAWQPETESRTLGFQLFGLEWGPVD